MRVLIFGASGFIGFATAQALVRAGHHVIGQTRNEKNVELFTKEEIEPLILDPNSDSSWTKLIPTLDAIIDSQGGDNLYELASKTFKLAEEQAKARDETAAKLVYIYTSGTWVQGKDPFEVRSDGAPITQAPSLTAWRTKIEVPVRQSTVVNGLIIRPSLVYGRSGSITGMIFSQAAKEKQITWPGDRSTSLATIHVDDLAALFVLAVEKAPLVQGHVLDATNQLQESQEHLFSKLALLEGFSPDKITYKQPSNAFEEAVITSRPLRPSLGRSVLGWHPVKAGLTDGLPQYYRAFKASANLL